MFKDQQFRGSIVFQGGSKTEKCADRRGSSITPMVLLCATLNLTRKKQLENWKKGFLSRV